MSDQPNNKLMYVFDPIQQTDYLVDTGSSISVVPPSKLDLPNAFVSSLKAANGTPITLYGERLLNLSLGLRRDLTFKFIIADVSSPIIGIDF